MKKISASMALTTFSRCIATAPIALADGDQRRKGQDNDADRGADKSEVELMPGGDSRMEAKGKFNVSAGTKAVVEITPEGKKPSTLRFAIK